MSVKYRVRLQNGRVVGPFSTEEIGELYLKKHIHGDEACQQFPIGDWQHINVFFDLPALVKKNKNQDVTVTKIEISLDENDGFVSHDSTLSEVKSFQEFKFGKTSDVNVDYAELEKKYKIENSQNTTSSVQNDEQEEKEQEEKRAREIERERIIQKGPIQPDLDQGRTVVIPWKAGIPIKKNDKQHDKKEEIEEKEIVRIPTQKELINEKTEFLQLDKALATINSELSMSEIELEQRVRIEENNEKIRLRKLQAEIEKERVAAESLEEDDGEIENTDEDYNPNDIQFHQNVSTSGEIKFYKKPTKKRKKKMSIIVALAFFVIFYVLLFPDKKQKITGPLFINVQFPIVQEFEDRIGATNALVQGRALYSKNNYMSRSLAAQSYVASLQKQFNNNEALSDLILTYAELLDNSRDSKIAGATLYKLIQISENKMLSNLNIVTGASLFYGKIGKYQTGANLIKNYFRAKNPASGKLLAYDLELLINAGDLVEARKIFTKLKETPKKSFEVYYSLARFYEVDDKLSEAQSLVAEGLKQHPDSVLLLLKSADYLFKDQASSKKYEDVLKKVDQLSAENSPVFMAKFYYHMGLLNALKKKNVEATAFFKKSLAIKESDELRTILSNLEIGGDKFSKSLILESKVLSLVKKAEAELKNKNLEAAFSLSIEAIDAFPEYVPAVILHTKLQLRRGLFDSAIDTLQKAIFLNPGNIVLKKSLITTYIKSYKFEDARKMMIELSQTTYALKNEYASLMGDFYMAKGSPLLAIRWYTEALNRDPLSDYDMVQLAKIFIRLKKFNDAKTKLAKALLLDPKNPEYLAMNAEILFEQDSTDTAIGYLRDIISEVGEDATLLSSIATLYYKSGQIKEFNNYYQRLQNLPKKDEAFYTFLIYAAKLEEKKEEYITYSRELLKLNPGNLKIRLDLGEFFFYLKKYPEALAEFEEVKTKLTSYPQVHYMMARVYLGMNDIVNAKKMALKELELNPSLDTAYYIVGEVARVEKDYKEAVIKFEKAISFNPKSVDALMGMAWTKFNQGYVKESLELYGRATKEDRTNPEVYKQMGYAYKAIGQSALAKEKFEDYLKLSPGASDRDQIKSLITTLQ